ncbi:MAG: Cof-type HAD-IIB family hydrolase [Eubacteriaceae bacterium]|jgi:Cof subfamily protein (haloacid dehalogenase superfamily)
MNIKAIMTDIDGTLLNSDGKVSPETRQAIARAREQGIRFGLCTGRDILSLKKLLPFWGIEDLVDAIVGTGGAEIWDSEFETPEGCEFKLDGAVIADITDHFKDMDVNFAIPEHGILFTPKEDRHIRELTAKDHVPYKVVDFKEFLKKPRSKLLIVCEPETMDAVIERGRSFRNHAFRGSPLKTAAELYEYSDPRMTKSCGLEKYAALHGWTLDDICAFGDADNDSDMVRHAGVGVAMANGSDKTQRNADYITDDNDHDGIAKFIEQNIIVSPDHPETVAPDFA